MIRAGIGDHARPECLHATARVGGEVHLHALLARLRGGHQVLAPRLDPLHGAAEAPCQRRHRHVLGEDVHLQPEAAADVGRDHAHARLVQPQRGGQRGAHDPRRLARGPDGQRLAVPGGDGAARLQRRGREPAMGEGLAEDDGRAREGRLDVAAAVGAAEEDRVVAPRLLERHARGPDVVVHVDALHPVGGRVGGGRGHHGHRLTAEPWLAGQRRPRGGREAATAQARRERGGAEVVGTENGHDAVELAPPRRVEVSHEGMGVRAPDERRVQHARQDDVVHVRAATAEQPWVLDAFDARARVADQAPPFIESRPSRAAGPRRRSAPVGRAPSRAG